ncbi:hypothetical protein BFP72_03585 [Reichenbachiella sp. 5M10]|uniref:BamA/TamA family outer membrane protein n=1 Tax=Reichenbachiella sp. 5M10 TaxID=1889772 RepID=UPI000C3F0F89|nr:BamA/TamA family outer membrane protein [Reichenbachiella sp. 5M10]PIB34555.1 hypothetical protein BFP72_03585 [Reichenbachiella sp. 5M10]
MFLSQIAFGQESDSTQYKNTSLAVYPVFAYTPETKFNFGAIAFFVFDQNVRKKDSLYYRPTSITPYLVFTTNKQIQFKSEFDFFLKNGINFNLISRIYKYPDYYYGIGNDTDVDVSERYGNNYIQLEGKVLKPYTKHLFYGLTYDLQYNYIDPIQNGMLATQDPVGIEGGRNMGIGPAFSYDTRNSTIYPTHGKYINTSVSFFGEALGGEYNYVKYSFDFRHYFELLGPKNILTYQFRADLTSGKDVPFYKLNFIGGDNRLRGFDHGNLYVDNQSVYFQVEARQELFWRLGGVIFAGAGQVFDSFAQYDVDDIRFVYGLGGRFQAIKDKKLNLRMDIGFTDNGQHAIYLSVREAF